MSPRIRLIDVTLRDGNQSLWSAIGTDMRTMAEVAPWLDRAGFTSIDFTTSTHMGISVCYHRENPYEKIRLARQLMPNTPLIFMTTGMRFITWEPAPRAIIRLAMRVVIRHGIRRIQIFEPMNNLAALIEAAKIAREEGAERVVAGLVYSISPVHTDEFYVSYAEELAQAHDLIDIVCIKDLSGLLTPESRDDRSSASRKPRHNASRDPPPLHYGNGTALLLASCPTWCRDPSHCSPTPRRRDLSAICLPNGRELA